MVTNQAGMLLSLFVFVQSPKSHEGFKFWSLVANEPPTGWTEHFFFCYLSPCRHATVSRFFFTGSLQQSWCRGPGSFVLHAVQFTLLQSDEAPPPLKGCFHLVRLMTCVRLHESRVLHFLTRVLVGFMLVFLRRTVPEK